MPKPGSGSRDAIPPGHLCINRDISRGPLGVNLGKMSQTRNSTALHAQKLASANQGQTASRGNLREGRNLRGKRFSTTLMAEGKRPQILCTHGFLSGPLTLSSYSPWPGTSTEPQTTAGISTMCLKSPSSLGSEGCVSQLGVFSTGAWVSSANPHPSVFWDQLILSVWIKTSSFEMPISP